MEILSKTYTFNESTNEMLFDGYFVKINGVINHIKNVN